MALTKGDKEWIAGEIERQLAHLLVSFDAPHADTDRGTSGGYDGMTQYVDDYVEGDRRSRRRVVRARKPVGFHVTGRTGSPVRG